MRKSTLLKVAFVGMLGGSVLFMPLRAYAALDNASMSITPAQVYPSHSDVYQITLRNNSTSYIDTLSIAPPSGFTMTATDQPYILSGGRWYYGVYPDVLDIAPGESYTVHITATSSATLGALSWQFSFFGYARTGTPPVPNTGSPTATLHHTTGAAVGGSYTNTVSNSPVNPVTPTLPPTPTETESEISGTGIDSPTTVTGWLPAGPIDSLLVLPFTLMEGVYVANAAASGSYSYGPTLSFLGATKTLPNGQTLYDNMGSVLTGVISGGLCFFILLFWLKSVYARLQRATQLDSHHDDTWGVL